MSWAPGTIVVCLIPRDEWHVYRDHGHPAPDYHEYCTVVSDDGEWLDLAEYKTALFLRCNFRLAEGGACESERARAMKPQEIGK